MLPKFFIHTTLSVVDLPNLVPERQIVKSTSDGEQVGEGNPHRFACKCISFYKVCINSRAGFSASQIHLVRSGRRALSR